MANLFGNGHRIGTRPLGHGQRHGRNTRVKGFPFGPRHGEHAVFLRVSLQADTRHVAHIDRSAITRGHQEIGDLIKPLQGFTGSKFNLLAVLANGAQCKGLVGPFNLSRQSLQGQPCLCQSFRIGRDANFLRLFAHQICQANIGQRRDFHLHLTRHAGQICSSPAGGDIRFGRQGDDHDRHIINPAPHDQGFGNSIGNPVHIGA